MCGACAYLEIYKQLQWSAPTLIEQCPEFWNHNNVYDFKLIPCWLHLFETPWYVNANLYSFRPIIVYSRQFKIVCGLHINNNPVRIWFQFIWKTKGKVMHDRIYIDLIFYDCVEFKYWATIYTLWPIIQDGTIGNWPTLISLENGNSS